MDFIAEIRRRHFVSDESISSIAKSLKLSRTTVRNHLLMVEEPVYQRKNQSFPKLGNFQERLQQWLEVEYRLPKKQRRTAQRLPVLSLSKGLKACRQRAIGVPMTVCNVMLRLGNSNRS
jgi:hypothetical protein